MLRYFYPSTRVTQMSLTNFNDVFANEDLMAVILDMLSMYEAGNLRLARKWETSIVDLFKFRAPSLHIYEIESIFPHFVNETGNRLMQSNKNIHVAIGLVKSEKRLEDLDLECVSDGVENYGAAVSCFNVQNTLRRTEREHSGSYMGSWSDYDQSWNSKILRRTVDPLEFFLQSPRIYISIVNASTGKPIVPFSLTEHHGGLVPTNGMAIAKQNNACGRLKYSHDKRTPKWMTTSDQNFATVSRFKATTLLSSRLKTQFKIRAQVIGKGRVTNRRIAFKTESKAFSIVSRISKTQKAKEKRE